MLVSYARLIIHEKKEFPVLHSKKCFVHKKSHCLFYIKLQDLHKCCIRIVILIINILLNAIKGAYTMSISEKLNFVKEEGLDHSVKSKVNCFKRIDKIKGNVA